MPTTEPRISVVVPNYNHAKLLPRCLNALLQQPVLPLEIIVVDDASTDDSRAVLRTLAERHPLIRVHHNERNLGVCRTMNRGMELARGDWVMFPAADDEVRPGVFAHAVRMLRAHPQAGLCSGLCELHDAVTGLRWRIGGRMPAVAGFLSPQEMVALGRKHRLHISGQNAVYNKAALLAAGGWLPELRWFTDWFGAFVVGFRHGMCHVPEVLSVFNMAPTTYYHSARPAERREVLERMLELLESERYADVAPLIRTSGMLGGFGWPMLRVMAGRARYWNYMNAAFGRSLLRRAAEIAGRRWLPRWLARRCVRWFYGP
jgi:glycosyltransferase involved in cell wall biosynthesis